MSDIRDRLDKQLDSVRAVRDELEVKLHLGSADLRDQWAKLEKGWQHLEGRLKVLGNESEDVAKEIGETLEVLADQLRDGYDRVKKLL